MEKRTRKRVGRSRNRARIEDRREAGTTESRDERRPRILGVGTRSQEQTSLAFAHAVAEGIATYGSDRAWSFEHIKRHEGLVAMAHLAHHLCFRNCDDRQLGRRTLHPRRHHLPCGNSQSSTGLSSQAVLRFLHDKNRVHGEAAVFKSIHAHDGMLVARYTMYACLLCNIGYPCPLRMLSDNTEKCPISLLAVFATLALWHAPVLALRPFACRWPDIFAP